MRCTTLRQLLSLPLAICLLFIFLGFEALSFLLGLLVNRVVQAKLIS